MKNLALVCVVISLLSVASYSANTAPYADKKQNSQKHKKSISAGQAASMVKAKFGGKVLKVQSSGNGYRVKILKPDGRIISVFVDGVSGRIRG
ncbi:PepSY domain-containing protein [Thalassotalea sp. M1531]|uniref:PepSY domain-containing protein n=1 Tax=Thalassotalea algicola TaxID=2716224 RepID=A0A7Y0LCN2_9GAMM|nr:PepSY domain-containing protein [Thalassotalea algicola]NMP31216.1 PepSY domain-containing protein [Thalassotalea algicola]